VAQQAASIFVTEISSGYRDWRLVSVAHEEGDFHSFAAVLGNDVTIKAYREGTLPFPDGAIIAALYYRHVSSEENNKAFGRDQSFVPGPPTNIQFMIKDSKKYAATDGWGFGHFQDGKPSTDEAMMNTCFACHQQITHRLRDQRYPLVIHLPPAKNDHQDRLGVNSNHVATTCYFGGNGKNRARI
jgi:hypothetical protein